MSQIFFLSANTTIDPYPVYPAGMAAVAAALVAQGHQVTQVDFLAIGQSIAKLKRAVETCCPDVVCVSLRNIDSADSVRGDAGWYLGPSKSVMETIRGASSAPIVLGGPAFSILPEEILSYLDADFGIVGEGERAVCDLVKALNEGKAMPRIIRPEQVLLEGEQIGCPLLDENLVRFYVSESGMLSLQTKRGCPHNCLYCTYPSLEGKRLRIRDPRAVVEEVARMTRDFGVTSLFFTDSVFNDSEGQYLELAEELARRELGVRWCGFFRPQGISKEELALLKRSGLYALEVGTDAASDTTLAELRKGFTFSDVVAFSRLCSAAEIPCAHFVTFGGPGETPETLQEGLENLDQLGDCVVFGFTGLRVYPGTGLHARAVQDGLLAESSSLLRPVYYFSPHLNVDTMNVEVERVFRLCRGRCFPPSEGTERLHVMHRFGYRGILWDTLVSFPGHGASPESEDLPATSQGTQRS